MDDRKGYKGFFGIYALSLVVGITALIGTDKYHLHVALNMFHSDLLDSFFKYFTHVGDGLFIAVCALVLCFLNYRATILVAISGAASGLLAQGLKRLVFEDYLRPFGHIDQMPGLYLVQGLDLPEYFSFPSGHSTSAFALFFGLALMAKHKWVGAMYAVLAVLVAYSRVYLSNHFLEDIIAGSLLGVSVTLFVAMWVFRINNKWIDGSISFRK